MNDLHQDGHGGIMLASDDAPAVSTAQLSDLGFLMPIATPQVLRAAFAEKQRLYAAILDESDYIYSVSYTEHGKQRQAIYARRQDAEKAAATYMVDYRASPKKSGIVKLAAALGIEAKRKTSRGLPEDPNATYSYVVYEATHRRTGRTEEGIGWCDQRERGKIHDIIATADTRAYGRAVLRLAGFGDVSADEIIAGASSDELGSTIVLDAQPKKPPALPASTANDVVSAQRAWAKEAEGKPVASASAQQSQAAKELRAKARRGNEGAARALGNQGYSWDGPASDGIGYETFFVEAMPHETAISEVGWNLSGDGKDVPETPDKALAPAAYRSVPSVAMPDDDETITVAQATILSKVLVAKCGSREAARAWLQEHAGCDRSLHVKASQYESLMVAAKKE